jgi:dihydroneopterin aldolase
MKVSIKELLFKTIIGILPIERKKPQKVIIDIDFEYLFYKENDQFIDYSCVAKTVKKTMRKKQFKLIEDALIFLEKKLYKKYNISSLKIQITKPDILADCKVSVSN